MKIFVKILALVMIVSMLVSSCNNYGKKVTLAGTKGEVYYKGEGVTEADAKKLGDYLKTVDYINNNRESSFQLAKQGDTYVLKLVIIKAVYDTIKGIDDSYKALGALVSKNVFDNKKVDVVLTNDVFEGFKTIPYDAAYLKNLDAEGSGTNDFGKDILIDGTKGEVYIKGDGVTENDAQKLGQHLKEIGYMTDKAPASVQLMKSSDGYLVRFVYDQHYYETTPDVVKNFNIIRKSISENVFGGQNVAISLANNKMEDFATVANQ